MCSDINASLDGLKTALHELRSIGDEGFEGLLAHILSEITQKDFRLASSGLQLGIDGETLSGLNHISFEGKLYKTKINKNEVLSKITSIIAKPSPPDVWVLGATIEASTQLLSQVQTAAERNGIEILILDWPKSSTIPPLAVACAMAADRTEAFLNSHVSDPVKVENASASLRAIAGHEAFTDSSSRIMNLLTPGSLGAPIALRRNISWLSDVFENRSHARMVFGQRLAPFDEAPLPTQPRDTLVETIKNALSTLNQPSIVAILGKEGVGKSWLLAQSWKANLEPPITLIVPAIDIDSSCLANFDTFLIAELIKQTKEVVNDYNEIRWVKRFEQWRSLLPPARPRIVLCIDGLNQNSSFNWPRLLDGAASKLLTLGGILVLTDRLTHFDTRLSYAIDTPIHKIIVPEWTQEELAKILSEKDIPTSDLSSSVKDTLINPRVLGIAFELLELGSINSFKELSISRLMFEHIRAGEHYGDTSLTASQFSKKLSQHAQEIIDRVKSESSDDKLVFEISGERHFELEDGLLAVISERYFSVLTDDETRYQITEDGLSFALGLSIINKLIAAKRAKNDLTDTLDVLLEPIAALDKTAEAVFSATLIANVNVMCDPEISATLQSAYIQLQNINDDSFTIFVENQRLNPEAAMLAIEIITTSPKYVSRADWLTYAVRKLQCDPKSWRIISTHLKCWLARYSLAPDLSLHLKRSDDTEKYDSKLALAKERIELKISSLSSEERAFMSMHMVQDDSIDPDDLSVAAFEILAGMPLTDFALSIVAWAYAKALNTHMLMSAQHYENLIRFNTKDWESTREAIFFHSDFLRRSSTSFTGKWALVYLLRGTATVEDASLEKQLVDELTAGREKFPGWRLIEQYCSTDPCDPKSEEPQNIVQTVERISELPVSPLNARETITHDDHFFRMALPGLARFRLQDAIDVLIRLVDSVESRSDRSLFLCLVELEPHCAAFSRKHIETLLKVARMQAAKSEGKKEKAENYAWLSSQYSLLLTFPHISGDDQLATLKCLPPGNSPLVKLLDTIKQATPAAIEGALEKVLHLHKDQKKSIMFFIAQQEITLSRKIRNIIGSLIIDPEPVVRGLACALIVQLDDISLLKKFVDTGWVTTDMGEERNNYYENVQGSFAIIRAVKHGLLGTREAIARINVNAFDAAVLELGSSVRTEIVARLDVALHRCLEVVLSKQAPKTEMEIPLRPSLYPPSLGISTTWPKGDDSCRSQLEKLNESPEDFHRRQQQGWKIFKAFEAELSSKQALLILADVGVNAIAQASSIPNWANNTAKMLIDAPEDKLSRLNNFSLRLACELSRSEPILSIELYKKVSRLSGVVNVSYGPARIPLESYCVWSAADNKVWNLQRAERLNMAANDHELSIEVLAALLNGKLSFLEEYVKLKLSSPEPVSIARALLVLGLGSPSSFADSTLAEYREFGGFIGNAAKAAQYAYDREVWSRHWYQLMCNTSSATEYWRYSVLLLKIVDGRFAVWRNTCVKRSEPANLFEISLEARIGHRIQKWKSLREKRLLGDNVPNRVFLGVM